MINSTQFKSKYFLCWRFLLLILLSTGFTTKAATLTVSTSTLNVGYNSTIVTFNITADVSWNLSTSLTWIDLGPTFGSDNQTIGVYIQANTLLTSRTGTITISGSGGLSQTITVTQSGVSADAYESNDSEATAYNANFVFNNDIAVISIDSASIHSDTDVDYYKVNLPAGYTYKISSVLYDRDNYGYIYYSADGKYSYKIGSGS